METRISYDSKLRKVNLYMFSYDSERYTYLGGRDVGGQWASIPRESSRGHVSLCFGANNFSNEEIIINFESFAAIHDMVDWLVTALAWEENHIVSRRLSLEDAIEDADRKHFFRVWDYDMAHDEALNVNATMDAWESNGIKPKKRKMPKSA